MTKLNFTPPHNRKSKFSFKLLLNQFLLFLFILLAFSSCLEEQREIAPEVENQNQIAKVKDWFEANKQQLHIQNGGISFMTESQELILPFFEKEPDWDQFHHYTFPDGREVFEINLANVNVYYPNNLKDSLSGIDPSEVVIQNIMFVQNIETGGFSPFIARYYPTKISSILNFDQINYNNIPLDWSGMLDIWTYDERHYIGFEINKGKIHSNRKIGIQEKNGSIIPNWAGMDTVCTSHQISYTITETYSTSISPINTSETVVYATILTCVTSGGGSYSSVSQYGSYGGGGGSNSGNYLPPPTIILEEERIWAFLNQINSDLNYLIPCEELKEKLDYLVKLKPSAEIISRLNTLTGIDKSDWRIQDINDAKGHLINLDYFSVTLNKIPDPFTSPEQFLEHIRLNINDFIISENSEFFKPHPGIPGENAKWNFGQEGSIVSINIPVDNGSVVLSKKEPRKWIFTTIRDPYNHHHPVSGNREFGIIKLRDGRYEVYTMGADRLTMRFDQIASTMSKILWGPNGVQFFKADELWQSFQQRIKIFSEINGSNAIINNPILNRPDWDKVRNAIENNSPLPIICN